MLLYREEESGIVRSLRCSVKCPMVQMVDSEQMLFLSSVK